MAHAQKPDFFFRRNGRVHLNRRERQFSQLLAAEVCTSAVIMLGIPCSEVVWRVLATHSIRQFPLQFSSHASPCAITFQLDSTFLWPNNKNLCAVIAFCCTCTISVNSLRHHFLCFLRHCKGLFWSRVRNSADFFISFKWGFVLLSGVVSPAASVI